METKYNFIYVKFDVGFFSLKQKWLYYQIIRCLYFKNFTFFSLKSFKYKLMLSGYLKNWITIAKIKYLIDLKCRI